MINIVLVMIEIVTTTILVCWSYSNNKRFVEAYKVIFSVSQFENETFRGKK